ncbi:MAG: STAS domain-containing protein [Bacteroidia bacterium]
METTAEGNSGLNLNFREAGIALIPNLKIIHASDEGLIIKDHSAEDILHLSGEYPSYDIKGVYDHGVQYYDLRHVHFINNTDIAHLIDLLKSLLKKGVEVRFLNAGESVREKIRSMELDHILICC